jgi:hypothetical protein
MRFLRHRLCIAAKIVTVAGVCIAAAAMLHYGPRQLLHASVRVVDGGGNTNQPTRRAVGGLSPLGAKSQTSTKAPPVKTPGTVDPLWGQVRTMRKQPPILPHQQNSSAATSRFSSRRGPILALQGITGKHVADNAVAKSTSKDAAAKAPPKEQKKLPSARVPTSMLKKSKAIDLVSEDAMWGQARMKKGPKTASKRTRGTSQWQQSSTK